MYHDHTILDSSLVIKQTQLLRIQGRMYHFDTDSEVMIRSFGKNHTKIEWRSLWIFRQEGEYAL
jgi:hypothetical protein